MSTDATRDRDYPRTQQGQEVEGPPPRASQQPDGTLKAERDGPSRGQAGADREQTVRPVQEGA
jgi:hypothetical protein